MFRNFSFATPPLTTFRTLLALLFGLLVSISSFAQHRNFITSLEPLESVDRCRVFLGYIEEHKIENDKLPGFLNQVSQWAKNAQDQGLLQEIEFIRKKSEIYDEHLYDYPEEIKAFHRLRKEYAQKDQRLFEGYCLHHIAQFHFQNRQYAQAFEINFEAIKIFREIGFRNVPNIGKFLHDLALNHYFFKNYQEVIRLMKESIQLPAYNQNLDIQRYNNLGMAYAHISELDSAHIYLRKTLEKANRYGSNIWKGITHNNLGEMAFDQKNYDEALYHFSKHSEFNPKGIHKVADLGNCVNLGKVYVKLNRLDLASNYLSQAEEWMRTISTQYLGEREQLQKIKKRYFQAKIEFLQKKERYKEATSLHDSLNRIQSILDTDYNKALVMLTTERMRIKEHQLKLKEAQREKDRQNYLYNLIILVVVGIAIAAIGLQYIAQLKKKRQNEKLLANQQIILLEKQKKQKELENAYAQIDHFVSKIQEQNRIVEEFQNKLNLSRNRESEEKSLIKDARSKLKNLKILTDEDWFHFNDNFEIIYPEVAQALNNHVPLITLSEKRYLMLRQLNFTHKEMAVIIGVSESTMRVTLNRVRKKLKMPANSSFEEILAALLNQTS